MSDGVTEALDMSGALRPEDESTHEGAVADKTADERSAMRRGHARLVNDWSI